LYVTHANGLANADLLTHADPLFMLHC